MADDTIAIEFCGIKFKTPLVLLSGCVGWGREYTRVHGFSYDEVGAVCLKGTTLKPRDGNQPHRIAEVPGGMLNAIGLQNPGAIQAVKEYLPLLDHNETNYIANVSGASIEEYTEVTAIFDNSPVAAIELNVSCPNVSHGGMEFGNSTTMSAAVVEACRKRTSKPLLTKMSPNQTDIAENAKACIEAGSDALAVINTVTAMAIDAESRTPVLANVQGGMSGAAIKPIALLRVHQVYQVAKQHNVPIIGQGGVCNGTDALEFIIAGATAVGVGTGLFYDPLLCRQLNKEISDYLHRHNMTMQSLTGSLQV